MELLLFGVKALLCVVACRERCLHLSAIVGERELRVHDLHADLGVELSEAELGLTIFHQSAGLRGLSFTVAEGDGHAEAHSLVGCGAIEQVCQHGAVAIGREGARIVWQASSEVDRIRTLRSAES